MWSQYRPPVHVSRTFFSGSGCPFRSSSVTIVNSYCGVTDMADKAGPSQMGGLQPWMHGSTR